MSNASIKAIIKSSYGTLTYFDPVSPARMGECVQTAINEAKKNKIIPIMSQQVLHAIIKVLKEENDISAEFISYAGANGSFFSYTLGDLQDWEDSLCVLGTVGLVLDPSQSIEIIFPYLHGIRGLYRESKRNFSLQDVDCY